MTQPITQPDDMTDSRAQLLEMRANLMGHPRYADDPKYARLIEVAPDFEPSELSEIVDGLFITSRDGVEAAMMEGQFIINVTQKGELDTYYDAQISIHPYDPTNIIRLKTIALLIDELLKDHRAVAVHCSMGMERSVLAVAYFMHTKMDMGLDEAYAHIVERRPIAWDRREWAGLDEPGTTAIEPNVIPLAPTAYVCNDCESDDVVVDAYAQWCTTTQEWELSTTFEGSEDYCRNCDGPSRCHEIPLSELVTEEE